MLLLVPILLPIIGGTGIVLPGFHEDRPREIYAEAVCCLTSVLVWIALLFGRRERIELYAFTRGFSIDLTMDGLSMLFAGMVNYDMFLQHVQEQITLRYTFPLKQRYSWLVAVKANLHQYEQAQAWQVGIETGLTF